MWSTTSVEISTVDDPSLSSDVTDYFENTVTVNEYYNSDEDRDAGVFAFSEQSETGFQYVRSSSGGGSDGGGGCEPPSCNMY